MFIVNFNYFSYVNVSDSYVIEAHDYLRKLVKLFNALICCYFGYNSMLYCCCLYYMGYKVVINTGFMYDLCVQQ